MIAYLIKSVCCAAILLLVYLLFLEKEKMHRFNRIYLLGSAVLSCILPCIHLTVPHGVEAVEATIQVIWSENIQQQITGIAEPAGSAIHPVPRQTVVVILYGFITAVLLTRFCLRLYRLMYAYADRPVLVYENTKLVLLENNASSYTFLNTIFISRQDYETDQAEILRHEIAHLRQKHSVDIIAIELIRVIFWFNPVYLYYKHCIQLNHEFLADDAVIQECPSVRSYQHLLLERIHLTGQPALSSRFNYSMTKKRLQMMMQTSNQKKAVLKQLALLPLLLSCLVLFNAGSASGQARVNTNIITGNNAAIQEGSNPFLFDKTTPFTKQGISAVEYEEYKTTEKKYLDPEQASPAAVYGFSDLLTTDRKRLQYLFLRMNRQQQSRVRIGFSKSSLVSVKKKAPTQMQIEAWKTQDIYGVWINGQKISNAELNNYQASDFTDYSAYTVNYDGKTSPYLMELNKKMKGDTMKKYKLSVMYTTRVELSTEDYYAHLQKIQLQSHRKNPYSMYIMTKGSPADIKGR